MVTAAKTGEHADGSCSASAIKLTMTDGPLSGYRWGVERKAELVKREWVAGWGARHGLFFSRNAAKYDSPGQRPGNRMRIRVKA